MKAAFNILPAKTDSPLHLLIEVGSYGISFLWFSKDPMDIKGLAAYNFLQEITAADMAAEITNLLNSNPVFSETTASTSIAYDFKESILVPATYHSMEAGKAMLELIYDADARSEYKTDGIEAISIFNDYAVDKKIAEALLTGFPMATCYHASSLQLKRPVPGGERLSCIIFHNSIKLFLFKDNKLQLVQQFGYTKPVDVAYHLLNCCQQYEINATSVELELSGMIDAHSNLYNELHKYFLNISFEQQDPAITAQERIRFYPTHFFSHLTALATCVS